MPFGFPEAIPYGAAAPANPFVPPTVATGRAAQDPGRVTAGTVPDRSVMPQGASPFENIPGMNPTQYATLDTANNIAQMFGGNVVQSRGFDAPGFGYNPQNLIQDGGYLGNAGLISDRLRKAQEGGYYQNELANLQAEAAREKAGNPGTAADSVFNPASPNAMFQPVQGGWNSQDPINFGAAATGQTPATSGALPTAPQIPQAPATISPGGGRPAGTTNPTTPATPGGATGGAGSINPQTGLPNNQSNFGTGAANSTTQYGSTAAPQVSTPNIGTSTNNGIADLFNTNNTSGNSVDNFLADLTNDTGWSRNMAADGMSVDQMPAWNSMLQAQQRNKDRNAAQLREQTAMGGNAFSTVMGDVMGNFYNQANADENANLTAAQTQASEAARGRQANASNVLAGLSANAGSQLSSQDFQSLMQQGNQGFQAAMQLSGGADQAAQALAGYGNQAGQQLLNNSMQAGTNLYNTENMAGMQLNQNQLAALQQMMQYDTTLRNTNIGAAGGLSGALGNWLGIGSQLGQQQIGVDQLNQDRQFEEWLRTRPEYSPLLPYLSALSTNQPVQYQPQYRPSGFSQIAGAIGALAQGAGAVGVRV